MKPSQKRQNVKFSSSPVLGVHLPMWRSKLVVLIISAAFASLLGRAFWIQVANQDFYIEQGQKRYQRTIELEATRGRIVDRHGAMLAVSLPTFEIWATPRLCCVHIQSLNHAGAPL